LNIIKEEGKLEAQNQEKGSKTLDLWEKYLRKNKNTNMQKSDIQQLIAQNRIKEALNALNSTLPSHEENSIIMLQSQWNSLERNNNMGALSSGEYNVSRAKIVSAMLSLADSIVENQPPISNDYITITKTISVPKDFKGGVFRNTIEPFDVSQMVTFEPDTTGQKIFFSYAWGDDRETGESREKIVNDLYDALIKDNFDVIRDKIDLGYKGFISEFMTKIGKSDKIIVVISEKYVRSPYCMFELCEIARNCKFEKSEFRDKVIPLKIEHIDFSDPLILDEYLGYWEEQQQKWEVLFQKRIGQLSGEQHDRYEKIKMIHQNIGKLMDWLADMNTLSPKILSENNFEIIKAEIKKR
jgi:hypothetical protein